MNKSLKQYLDSFKLEKPPPKPQKISEKFKNPNNVIFENWLNANLEQKNLKNHDLHLEEYEEVPEENLHPTDYRIEIEKRFHNSVINKIYTFPRIDNEISILSDNSSIDSIKNVIFYELSSQNYQNPVNTAKSTHDLTKKMSLGVNYKQFLNLLEQTIKNVNISDLKKIKMNNFFLKEKNDILTPHFVTTKHNDVVQKLENKFNLKKKNGNSLGKTKATIENLGKMNILQKTDVDNRKNNDSNSKVLDNIHNKFSKKIIKGKKLNINPRSQAISFTQSNYNQLNSPSFTINKHVNQTSEEKRHNLPIFLKNAIKKAKDLQILDKDLIRNLNIYKTNEKKTLYQNIHKKIANNSTKDTDKRHFSSNEKNPLTTYKIKAPLTSKHIVDSLEKIHLGSQSEENRNMFKKMHNKKLTDLMKCYELEDFNLKSNSTKFKTTTQNATVFNEKNKDNIRKNGESHNFKGKNKRFYKSNTSEEFGDFKESFEKFIV